MAKMSQEMYGATGKVGNKVYYRANGKTVVREAVDPKNPKTDAQTIQRVIAAQVGKSYNKFRDICDHSFEGVATGAQSMNRFRKLNMRYARSRAAEIQQSGNSLAQFYNFQPIGSQKWVPGAAIIAQGQLPKVEVYVGQHTSGIYVGSLPIETNTYAGVINKLGLKRGDQLTFICVNKFDGEYSVEKARVILDPRNADGSGAALSTPFVQDGAIQLPNWKNNGSFDFLQIVGSDVDFVVGRGTTVAVAVIASRKDGNDWLYSNTTLVLSEEACGTDLCSLWDAMQSSYQASDIDLESELYLHNAGVGGGQGSSQAAPTPSTDPTYNNTVTLNGVQQSVAGGSASITAPFNTAIITGTNLTNAPVTAKKSGSEETISPTSKTATTITFSELAGAAGETFTFYKGENAWFTVTVSAGGGGSYDDDDQN